MNAINSVDILDEILNDMRVPELTHLVKRLVWNKGYGCFTRAGFEEVVWPAIKGDALWAVFLDIDGLHALNSKFDTYEPVNAMIFKALSVLRESDIKAGQLNSGDEIFIFLCKNENRERAIDPQGVVGRLVEAFSEQGMSATFAVVPVVSDDLITNLQPAIKRVKDIKEKRGDTR